MPHQPGAIPGATGEFSGKVALVTGGASGIGAACAGLLAEGGAVVYAADLTLSTGLLPLDVTEDVQWEALVARILNERFRLDILVHAAGISAASPILDTGLAEWRRVLATNLDGAFLAVKHGMRAMGKEGGAIILLGSASGTRPAAGAAAYSTSKAGVAMLARTAAKECRDGGLAIRVNVVSPAGVKTPMWSRMPFFQDLVVKLGSEAAAYESITAAGGGVFADPREIAASVCFLASDAARHVTGVELLVDGGYVL